MQQWGYMYIDYASVGVYAINGQNGNRPYPNLAEYLSSMGNDGWELVGVSAVTSGNGVRLFFKRPLP